MGISGGCGPGMAASPPVRSRPMSSEPWFAGLTSGVFATIVTHPLDTLKTQLQARSPSALAGCNGGSNAPSAAWWRFPLPARAAVMFKGLVPGVILQGSSWAYLCAVQEALSLQLLRHSLLSPSNSGDSSVPQSGPRGGAASHTSRSHKMICDSVAGAVAGGSMAVLLNPLEAMKTRLQVGHRALAGGTLRGTLWRGMVPSVTRCALGNAVFFPVSIETFEYL